MYAYIINLHQGIPCTLTSKMYLKTTQSITVVGVDNPNSFTIKYMTKLYD